MFQWHYETFDLPEGARRILASPWIANQAYVVGDRHLGMQGHVEITAAIARSWVVQSGVELPRASTPSMQCAADLLRDLDVRVAASNAVADDVYARWARRLVH
jgi:GMP synthase-like glutamine amidotransferase